MIKENTVLVLGAGASCSYGLPLGDELNNRIASRFRGYDFIREAINNHIGGIDEFCETFRLSQAPSIDEYLATRPQKLEVGKAAIAAIILASENFEALFAIPTASDKEKNKYPDPWYKYLWKQLTHGVPLEEFERNRFSVITFNYDRSLETYLGVAARNRYGLDDRGTSNLLSTIKIIHVYGSVAGPYGGVGDQPVEERLRPQYLKLSSSGIHIVPETRSEVKELDQCYELLRQADRICYLGFGYDEQNLIRIKVADAGNLDGRNRRIWGTTLGLTYAEATKAAMLCRAHYSPSNESIPFFRSLNCTQLLRESLILG